jgi:hypothetical protein
MACGVGNSSRRSAPHHDRRGGHAAATVIGIRIRAADPLPHRLLTRCLTRAGVSQGIDILGEAPPFRAALREQPFLFWGGPGKGLDARR